MASKLERAKQVFRSFITEEQTKEAFEVLWNQVQEQNKDNVMAHIPVGHVDTDIRNISEMTYCEDYEVISHDRLDDEGNVFNSQEKYDEHILEKADEIFSEWKIIKTVMDNGDIYFDVYDEDGGAVDRFNSEEGAEYFIQETKKDWMWKQEAYDDLEFETHEIYWNTVWRFNNHMNRDIAVEVGLGVLELYHEDNDEYLFLRGCGMDLSPQLMAYHALAHGYISEEYLKHFHDVEYTRYVLGTKLFNKVVQKLDLERFFQV